MFFFFCRFRCCMLFLLAYGVYNAASFSFFPTLLLCGTGICVACRQKVRLLYADRYVMHTFMLLDE